MSKSLKEINKKENKIIVIIFLLSLTFIVLFEHYFYPEKMKIKDISLFDLNKPAIIIAEVKNQNNHKGHLFLTLKDKRGDKIEGVFFEKNTTLPNKKGKFLIRIDQYLGEPQVQVQKVVY